MTSTVLNLTLRPVVGFRFQPTGFPDLGAATYQAHVSGEGWVQALHLESPQSMANRLELCTWDPAANDQAEALRGLPYVRVVDAGGGFLTSSRLEAHRLASAYLMDAKIDGGTGRVWLEDRLGLVKGRLVDHRALAKAIFDLDPVSLIHGVFFAQKQWPSQPKIARAITCFIDALDVRPAVSGGVKTDSVNPSNDEGRGAKEGYGMVPHQRVEYTARDITASVVVDHGQIRSYGLGEKAEAVLNALVDFELASLFRQDGLRLRTACHLVVDQDCEDLAKIPTLDEATAKLRQSIDQHGDFAPTSELKWTGGGK